MVLAAVLAVGAGAGIDADSAVLAAVALPPLMWAAWRPSWLSGVVATGTTAVPLAFSIWGIALVPVVAGAIGAGCIGRVTYDDS